MKDYAPETRYLIMALIDAGFTMVSADNGEDELKVVSTTTIDALIEALYACDESHLNVIDPAGNEQWLYLVYGNDPGELVCDYSMPAEGTDYIEAVATAHAEHWETRPQPMKPEVKP